MSTIGKRIRDLRIEKGMTQEELGELLGVKKAAVQKYENGTIVNLKADTIKKLCEIFQVLPYKFIITDDLKVEHDLLGLGARSNNWFRKVLKLRYNRDLSNELEIVESLNDEALSKLMEYAGDLSKIPEYRRKEKRDFKEFADY